MANPFSGLKPNSPSKFIAWFFTIKGVLQYLLEFVNTASNLDFAITARGNPRVVAIWHFLVSPLGNLIFTAIGIGWLYWISRHSDSDATASHVAPAQADSRGLDSQSQDSEDVPPTAKPNIVCLGSKVVHAVDADHGLKEGTHHDKGLAAIAEYSNEPKAGRPTAPTDKVIARVTYCTEKGELHRIERGLWLEQKYNSTTFDAGAIKKLLIAKKWGWGDSVAAYETTDESGLWDDELKLLWLHLLGNSFDVEVRIITLNGGHILAESKFKLSLTPEFKIEAATS